jgi:hypothetical protein
MIGIATISTQHLLAALACTWLQGVWGVSNILSWTLVAVNVAGHTKRTTANAVWFVFYAAENIIGPFLFLPDEAPRYLTAIKALAGMFGSRIFFTVCLGGIMFVENRRREWVVSEGVRMRRGLGIGWMGRIWLLGISCKLMCTLLPLK